MQTPILKSWFKKLEFRRADLRNDKDSEAFDAEKPGDSGVVCHPNDANLITSKLYNGKHILMLDLDVEHQYHKSTTNGHLYIDKELEFDDMLEVLTVLVKHGIVQKGWLEASKHRGFAALRVPGMDKYSANDNKGFETNEEH